jgi:hypothetical protein
MAEIVSRALPSAEAEHRVSGNLSEEDGEVEEENFDAARVVAHGDVVGRRVAESQQAEDARDDVDGRDEEHHEDDDLCVRADVPLLQARVYRDPAQVTLRNKIDTMLTVKKEYQESKSFQEEERERDLHYRIFSSFNKSECGRFVAQSSLPFFAEKQFGFKTGLLIGSMDAYERVNSQCRHDLIESNVKP